MRRTIFRKKLRAFDASLYKIAALFFRRTKNIETGRQFLTFAVIGVGNTIIDFGIYYLLTRYTIFFNYHTPGRYVANSISFLIATTFSFWMNRSWTFRRKDRPTLSESLRFYATTVGGLFVNNFFLFFLGDFIGINDLVAKAFSTVFSTIWNFVFKKLWVFTPVTDSEDVSAVARMRPTGDASQGQTT